MGRFSYIPLEIQNINDGLEREIMLDYANQDLYVLDDYKVPVSITKDLKIQFNNIRERTNILLDKSRKLMADSQDMVDKLDGYAENLYQKWEYFETTLKPRADKVITNVSFLVDWGNEIERDVDNNIRRLNNMFNGFNNSILSLYNKMKSRYDKCFKLVEQYQLWIDEYYKEAYKFYELELQMSDGLYRKMNGLGKSTGSYNFGSHKEYTTRKSFTVYLYSDFAWDKRYHSRSTPPKFSKDLICGMSSLFKISTNYGLDGKAPYYSQRLKQQKRGDRTSKDPVIKNPKLSHQVYGYSGGAYKDPMLMHSKKFPKRSSNSDLDKNVAGIIQGPYGNKSDYSNLSNKKVGANCINNLRWWHNSLKGDYGSHLQDYVWCSGSKSGGGTTLSGGKFTSWKLANCTYKHKFKVTTKEVTDSEGTWILSIIDGRL